MVRPRKVGLPKLMMIRNFLPRSTRALLLGACLLGVNSVPTVTLHAAEIPGDALVKSAFEKGTLSQGNDALEKAIAAQADPNAPAAVRARYALAIVQFLRSAERLGQSWRHYGLNVNAAAGGLPFLRLPVGQADPATAAPLAYEDFRTVLATFLADVQTAEKTFAALPDDPGTVSLRPGLIRLDYVGDGKPASTETVWRTYQRLNRGAHLSEVDAGKFLIKFDAGDVPWFRGYCHLLSALAETVLAYDESQLFDHTAHVFFPRPKTPFPFLLNGSGEQKEPFDPVAIADYVTFIHLLRFPVREPARLTAAWADLQQVPALSRESWRRIQAETDDDHEWLPNPRQTGVIPGVKVAQEQIDAWLRAMEEADAILAGKKLLPFWRGGKSEPRGINLRRVFTEPTEFDLVLWLQGTEAAPYLEKGPVTDPKFWNDISGTFEGNALGFALYFN